jgi:hypothetical protein
MSPAFSLGIVHLVGARVLAARAGRDCESARRRRARQGVVLRRDDASIVEQALVVGEEHTAGAVDDDGAGS